jgi:uncharacterized protein (DUF2147 family)
MIKPHHILPAIIVACLSGPVNAVSPATTARTAEPKPTGEWVVADKTARIHIAPCKDALWGVISWTEKPGTDENNPDPALRDRPVVGMPILLNLKQAEPNSWEGEVYNAQNGKTYMAKISLAGEDVLRIEGCVLGGLFCGGENWTREAAVAPTDAPPATAPTPLPEEICPSA